MTGKFLSAAILATLLVGSNAMATIARQAVLGNGPIFTTTGATALSTTAVNGSLWYDDDYNVFYNPAYVNDNKNYATVQKGFEGGWFKSEFENFAYGVYVNRGGSGAGGTGNAGNAYGNTGLVAPGFGNTTAFVGAANALDTMRPIDLFFGGDTGMKWGFHVAWAYNRNQLVGLQPNNGSAEVTNRYWHFDLGAEVMGFEPFIGATVFSKYQNTVSTSAPAAADLNEFNAGFRYKYEGWTPYAVFKKFRESGIAAGAANQTQTRNNIVGVGIGHDTKVADGVHILKNIGVWMSSVEDDNATVTPATLTGGQPNADAQKNYKDYVLPINVAIEAEATSWLTLRAGASFDVINNRKFQSTNLGNSPNPVPITNANVSQSGNTSFRVGSTVKFGKLHVDSAFGTGGGAGAAALDGTNTGFDSQTFALLSTSYHW